ncbi:MAG: nitroreductase family protein [Candidatus Woesearchaeota archaeon]|jgi:nitroreductase|nr:nitroreductase family protein [Candidatus Woesearchaeota archaeon]
MTIENIIKERRSIRKYIDKKVTFDKIGKIIEAGIYAPSSGNIQNWSFIIVRDTQKKEEIAAASLKQYWMTTAYAYIIICNNTQKIEKLYGNHGKIYSTQNCALAAENMMLMAESLGLSTCFVGAFDHNAISRILKLPSTIIPEIILTLGYGDEKPIKTSRDPIEKVTFFEEYGKKMVDDFSFWPLQKFEKDIKDLREKHSKKVSEFYKKIKK